MFQKSHTSKPSVTKLRINFFSYTLISVNFFKNYVFKKVLSHFFLKQYLKKYSFSKNRIKIDTIRVSSIVGNLFEAVYERRLSKNELENLFLAGAITPLFDEFCDKYNFDDKILNQIIYNKHVSIDNPKVNLFITLINSLRKRINNNKQLEFSGKQIFDIQLYSKIQKSDVDLCLIRDISYQKGGYSILFYTSCIDSVPSEKQKEVLYSFGAYIQLLDDIFDIGSDMAEGSNTLATMNILTIENIFKELEFLLEKNIIEIDELNLSGKNKKKLMGIYSLLLVPALTYLNTLQRAAKNEDLVDKNNQLNPKYKWHSWNTKNVFQLLKTLYSIS